MLIDTHAHIHFDNFKGNLDEVFENASEANVKSIFTVGTNLEDSKKAVEFVNNYRDNETSKGIKLFSTIGIHPHDAEQEQDNILKLKNLYTQNSNSNNIVAIGECGLDYFKNQNSKDSQKKVLIRHLELASDLNMPLVFHVRDAWDDFFEILSSFKGTRGVIHSFTGNSSHVANALEHNLYFGLNGIITFSKEKSLLDAVVEMPEDKIVLETDCPFLAPVPHRGKPNQPSFIVDTFEFLADLKKTDKSRLLKLIENNTNQLFSL